MFVILVTRARPWSDEVYTSYCTSKHRHYKQHAHAITSAMRMHEHTYVFDDEKLIPVLALDNNPCAIAISFFPEGIHTSAALIRRQFHCQIRSEDVNVVPSIPSSGTLLRYDNISSFLLANVTFTSEGATPRVFDGDGGGG